MLWGLDRDAWISIWSGTLGAIPAAVLAAGAAAWVAVMVLSRSNKHQQDLVEQQLSAQRTSVALEREMSAMAEVLAAASKFTYLPYDASRADAMEQIAGFRAAVYRWALETQEMKFLGELERSSQILAVGTLRAIGLPTDSSWYLICVSTVQRMVDGLTEFGLEWYATEPRDRERSGMRLTMKNDELAAKLDDIDEQELASRSAP